MPKIRKQIYLEAKQDQQLKRLAEARGVSEAEVVRQAIEHEAASAATRPLPHNPGALEDFVKAALARRKLGITAPPYRWSREELYAERLDRWYRRDR